VLLVPTAETSHSYCLVVLLTLLIDILLYI